MTSWLRRRRGSQGEDGIDKDARYWILKSFTLPHAFELAPSTEMNGRARWTAYRLDVFIDRDRDVLTTAPGEPAAGTGHLVPLGTEGLVLELRERAR